MATHKTEEFSSDDQQVSLIAKVMGHPARIAILRLLAANKRMTCGNIVDILPLAQATVSHHLKELHDAKILNLVHEGKKSYYEVNLENWNSYTTEFNNLSDLLNKSE